MTQLLRLSHTTSHMTRILEDPTTVQTGEVVHQVSKGNQGEGQGDGTGSSREGQGPGQQGSHQAAAAAAVRVASPGPEAAA